MYDGESLARGLLSILHSVGEDWSANLPVMTAPKDKVELSIFAIKNTRRKMEDRHAVCVDVNSLYSLKVSAAVVHPTSPHSAVLTLFQGYPHQAYYAVFDGHIGVEAASYASACLLTNIVRHQAFQDDPLTALKAAIKITDENVCNKVRDPLCPFSQHFTPCPTEPASQWDHCRGLPAAWRQAVHRVGGGFPGHDRERGCALTVGGTSQT